MTMAGGAHSDQNHFRFYNDGTEAGATALANEDTNVIISRANFLTIYQLRIGASWFSCLCGTLSIARQFEFSLNGGAFANVTTSSTVIRAVTGATADETNTTNRLTLPGGSSFSAGKVTVDGLTSSKTFNSVNEWEDVLPFNIMNADVSDGNTIDIRIKGLNNYGVTPRITISKQSNGTGFFRMFGP